jgi:hypothetical protein
MQQNDDGKVPCSALTEQNHLWNSTGSSNVDGVVRTRVIGTSFGDAATFVTAGLQIY